MDLRMCTCGCHPVVDDLTLGAGFAVVRCANLYCGRAANGPGRMLAAMHWNRIIDEANEAAVRLAQHDREKPDHER